jgi:ABC-2 type transport system ATP-binding protein
LIKELGKLGTTLIVSSHILNELEDFCSSLVIMERGHILRSGKVEHLLTEFTSGTPVCIELISREEAAALSANLSDNASITELSLYESVLQFSFAGGREELAQLHRDLVVSFNGIVSFYERKLTIEDVFMALGSHQVS